MVTVDEETQAKEFLKRAEIRTMKKDLLSLREGDSLRERDKIAHIKTFEEQKAELDKKFQTEEALRAQTQKADLEEVLQKNEGQERIAEKDLKNYATEQERQQIFLFESQRLAFEKQADEIDKQKDPALKLEKNKLLLLKRDQQAKLNSVLDEERKLENEQKFIIEKEQASTMPAQRKGLEQSRADLDKKIQEVEKKRWEAEKQVQDTDKKASEIDRSSENLVTEKNRLQDKILGADKSLRDIYSAVMAREEEKRRGQAADQIATREATAKIRLKEKEGVQRQQWSPSSVTRPQGGSAKDGEYANRIPMPSREKIFQTTPAEEEQRKKFMQDVEGSAEDKRQPQAIQPPALPMPPVPHRKN